MKATEVVVGGKKFENLKIWEFENLKIVAAPRIEICQAG